MNWFFYVRWRMEILLYDKTWLLFEEAIFNSERKIIMRLVIKVLAIHSFHLDYRYSYRRIYKK